MKIDLSKYVGQEVEVTFSSGKTLVGKVTYIPSDSGSKLDYRIGSEKHHTFTVDGFYYSTRSPNNLNNIIKITSMKKYQELEQQVKELQKEIERLKAQGNNNKIPEDFNLDYALSFLDSPNSEYLNDMFNWYSSPQGVTYWGSICNKLEENSDYKVPDEAIIQIQKWVIEFYRNKGGQ
jgi:hypothetical protein